MKIVWMINGLISIAANVYNNTVSQSGGWIGKAFHQLRPYIYRGEIELHIFAAIKNEDKHIVYEPNCEFHFVKWTKSNCGDVPAKHDEKNLYQHMDAVKPDLIMLWGSEYSFTYSGSKYAADRKIPLLLYVQGVANAFRNHFNGDLPIGEMARHLSVIDKLKLLQVQQYYSRFMRQAKLETEIFKNLDGVISDNDWCFSQVKAVNKTVCCYNSLLPLNNLFQEAEWKGSEEGKPNIFTIAGRNAYKGLHVLIQAMAFVKEQCPDIVLNIPGNMSYGEPALLKRPPYIAYLMRLIQELNLEENVKFLGRLSPQEMCEKIQNCTCYVMPSIIENHSSSLREAMFVGAPCISALVGSVGDVISNGESGLLYRDDDCYALANAIMSMLRAPEWAKQLARKGNQHIRTMYEAGASQSLFETYSEAIADYADHRNRS